MGIKMGMAGLEHNGRIFFSSSNIKFGISHQACFTPFLHKKQGCIMISEYVSCALLTTQRLTGSIQKSLASGTFCRHSLIFLCHIS